MNEDPVAYYDGPEMRATCINKDAEIEVAEKYWDEISQKQVGHGYKPVTAICNSHRYLRLRCKGLEKENKKLEAKNHELTNLIQTYVKLTNSSK